MQFALTGKRLAAVTLFGIVAISGIGCASAQQSVDWQKTVAAAQKEKLVVLYTSFVPSAVERISAAFKKAYPQISLEVSRGTSFQLISKMAQERAANISEGADVYVSTEMGWFADRDREGSLLKPAGPASATWPAQYRNGSTVVLALEPLVMLYNKNLVATPPKAYQDVLKPEYKGKIGTSTLAATVVVAWADWIEKTQGSEYLARLKMLNPKFYVGATPLAQAIASGEVAISPFGTMSSAGSVKEQGGPIGIVLPVPALGMEYGGAALGWSKRPDAALVFMDYLMSVEGQTVLHSSGSTASPRPGITESLQAASITTWDASKYTSDFTKKYGEHWDKIFK